MQQCARHEALSVASCTRCGRFACAECRRWRQGRPFCVECLARLPDRPSRQAVAALLFATFGLLVFVTGPIAVVLAHRELKAIAQGESPEASEAFATAARNVGWFEVVVLFVSALVLAVRAFG